jgi:hypothetical protein
MEEIAITREITSINVNGIEYIRQQNPERPQTDSEGRFIFVRADGTEDDELICDDIYSDNPEIFRKTFTLTSITIGGEPMLEE